MFHINIIGCGFVGLSTLKHIVVNSKIKLDKISFRLIDTQDVLDTLDSNVFISKTLSFINYTTLDCDEFYNSYKKVKDKKQYYVICVPTDYNSVLENLNILLLHKYVNLLKNEYVLIRSTLPLSYTDSFCNNDSLMYIPEFLRELKVKSDFNKPINIIGINSKLHLQSLRIYKTFKMFFKSSDSLQILNLNETAIIKLATNSYLSMRLVFFKQLDSVLNLYNTEADVIKIMCQNDSRVGNQYNSPPYLPLGKCLPKDTKSFFNDTKDLNNKSLMSILESVVQYQ